MIVSQQFHRLRHLAGKPILAAQYPIGPDSHPSPSRTQRTFFNNDLIKDSIEPVSVCWLRRLSVFLLAGLFLMGASPPPSRASQNGIRSAQFSVDIRGAPLGEVLKQISDETDYQLTIDPKWNDVPITASFKMLPIELGLRRILSDLNYSLSFNDAERRIFIHVKSFRDDAVPKESPQIKAADDPLPWASPPSDANSRSIINPGDIQVIPPSEPGRAGLTLKEIQKTEAQRVEISPEDIEVIPPGKAGGKGVSLREINAYQSLQKPAEFNEAELLPPDGFQRN